MTFARASRPWHLLAAASPTYALLRLFPANDARLTLTLAREMKSRGERFGIHRDKGA